MKVNFELGENDKKKIKQFVLPVAITDFLHMFLGTAYPWGSSNGCRDHIWMKIIVGDAYIIGAVIFSFFSINRLFRDVKKITYNNFLPSEAFLTECSNAYIPSGMYRSVEWNKPLQNQHPVKDASLTGCGNSFSTERSIPNGMQFRECRALQVIYFSLLKQKDNSKY
jgi:hypothetical protein